MKLQKSKIKNTIRNKLTINYTTSYKYIIIRPQPKYDDANTESSVESKKFLYVLLFKFPNKKVDHLFKFVITAKLILFRST